MMVKFHSQASSDLSILDFDVPFSISYVASSGIELLTTIGIMVSITWQVLIAAVLATVASNYIQVYSLLFPWFLFCWSFILSLLKRNRNLVYIYMYASFIVISTIHIASNPIFYARTNTLKLIVPLSERKFIVGVLPLIVSIQMINWKIFLLRLSEVLE